MANEVFLSHLNKAYDDLVVNYHQAGFEQEILFIRKVEEEAPVIKENLNEEQPQSRMGGGNRLASSRVAA